MPDALPLTAASTRLHPDFEALWAAYPPRRPNPRAAAHATWRVIVRSVDAAQLVAAARAFSAEVTAKQIKPEFVPHLRTWLAQQRYLDYPPFTPASPAAGAPAQASGGIDHPWWPEAERSGLTLAEFRAWLGKLRPLGVDAERGLGYVAAPTAFIADYVEQHYGALLCRALGVRAVRISTETPLAETQARALREGGR